MSEESKIKRDLGSKEKMKIQIEGNDVLIDNHEPSAEQLDQAILALLTKREATRGSSDMEFPRGQSIPSVTDPRYYTEIAVNDPGHSMLAFKLPGIGWHAILIPWNEVANTIRLWTEQMAFLSGNNTHSGSKH